MCTTRKVSYHYSPGVERYFYGTKHPMKPIRIAMAHTLVYDYGLLTKMDCYVPSGATAANMCEFHSDEYVRFLSKVDSHDVLQTKPFLERYNMGGDCPIFTGIFDFCAKYTGASLAAATSLMQNKCDIAINWSGGLHHAKKSKASGFCFVNDIVLAIMKLLRCYKRVLYIDIDVHHGDGVQEAFYLTDRVMTLSFHHYDENFFPGTGLPQEQGIGPGLGYALNIPFRQGINDEMYCRIFKSIVGSTVERFRPECIVLQCGADSLNGDCLGVFNLTLHGHGECVRFVKSLNIPLLVLGGGGYTPRNVARCWAYETAILLDTELPNSIPEQNVFYVDYRPCHLLFPPIERLHQNLNQEAYLTAVVEYFTERLRCLPCAPNVALGGQSVYFSPLSLLSG